MWRATVYAATARSLASRCLILRRLATNSKAAGRVLGCGSNVVDHIYSVKVVPRAGEKGFFVSPFKALEEKMIGGVTLNHLCWAALGGVPTSLLALQGEDALGIFIRRNLEKLNVSTEFIKVGSMYPTAQCHVFVQEDGERSIVMAPAATSLINSKAVMEHFDGPIQSCASMVTTEISQVPLSGVLELLRSARRAGVLSVLDVDVPPNVAVEEARLGSMEELIECVRMANVLKPSKMAAVGVVRAMNPSAVDEGEVSLQQVAVELARLCESKLVALTNGAEPTILVDSRYHVVQVDPPSIQKVVDTTGAGDAFLGGLLLGITRNGLPQSEGDMKDLATIANAFGATCVQSIGGVPNQHSKQVLERLLPTCMQEVTEEVVTGEDWWRRSAFAASVTVDQEAVGHIADDLLTPSRGRELQQFLKILEACEGHVLVSGVGKSGIVAQRMASSLTSVSIPATFIHATEWLHGDLGRALPGRDVVLFFSHSGNTEECVCAATHLVKKGVTTLSLTGNKDSKLSKLSVESLSYHSADVQELWGCVPTSSIVVQELLCNAVLRELIQRRGTRREAFKFNHPGGAIGAAPS